MRGRIALPKRCARNFNKTSRFREAFGVRTHPRVAFEEAALQ
jgi:hypothetical protein